MTTKHTPGPWKFIPERLAANGARIAGRCARIVRDDATGLEVAHVYRDGDAALIAAAPDTTDQLAGAIAWYDAKPGGWGTVEPRWVRDGRVALAKARGEA